MGKLSNQLFQNTKALVFKGRKTRQNLIDALDAVLIAQCPGGVVPSNTGHTIDPLAQIIVSLERIHFDEPCKGYTVKRLHSGENVHDWIENRKELIKNDTEAYLISGYTAQDLNDRIKEALPEEFKSVLEKEYEQDVIEEIDRERMKNMKGMTV